MSITMSGITVTGGMTFAVNGGGGFTPVTRSYTTGSGGSSTSSQGTFSTTFALTASGGSGGVTIF
jgi:hypothetical protein